MHELMIEQRLRPVDEATVMQEIIDERTIEINKVNKGLIEVQEMFADLSRIVKEQQIEIDTIFENCEESNAKTKEAHSNVLEANRLQKEGFCTIL
jgi:syntaxin 7